MSQPSKKTATYQRVWNDNETTREDCRGRIRVGVVGWVYAAMIDGETVETFRLLCELKKAFPDAKKAPLPAEGSPLVRVPMAFFSDHEERECEPFCTPVKTSRSFVWLRVTDPGLGELLDDARHYADPEATGDECRLRGSAMKTVAAIEAAMSP